MTYGILTKLRMVSLSASKARVDPEERQGTRPSVSLCLPRTFGIDPQTPLTTLCPCSQCGSELGTAPNPIPERAHPLWSDRVPSLLTNPVPAAPTAACLRVCHVQRAVLPSDSWRADGPLREVPPRQRHHSWGRRRNDAPAHHHPDSRGHLSRSHRLQALRSVRMDRAHRLRFPDGPNSPQRGLDRSQRTTHSTSVPALRLQPVPRDRQQCLAAMDYRLSAPRVARTLSSG